MTSRCGMNKSTKYRLNCTGPCGCFGDDVYCEEDNCIDHIINCETCQDDLDVVENIKEYACVSCGVRRQIIYSWKWENNNHIGSGFGLCLSCYNKFIKDKLNKCKNDTLQQTKKAIQDFKNRIKYGGPR